MQQNPPAALLPPALGLEEGSELLMTAGETAEQGNCLAGFSPERFPSSAITQPGSAGRGRVSLAPASLSHRGELTLTPHTGRGN